MPRGTDRYDGARVQGRLWTPAMMRGVAKLHAWYDAGDLNTISAASGALSAWRDKSGFGHDGSMTGTVTYSYPSASVPINGNNSVAVTGMPTAYDFFAVTAPNGTSFYRDLIFNGQNSQIIVLQTGTSNLGTWDGSFKQAGTQTWTAGAVGQMHMVFSATNAISMSRDGNALAACAGVSSATSTTPTLMNHSSNGLQGWGTVYEMMFTSVSLAAYEYQRVEGYLAWKWTKIGIADLVGLLPADHLYKRRPPLIGD